MKKLTLMAVMMLSVSAFVAPMMAHAATTDDVQSDTTAIKKDNTALKHDHTTMKQNRAAKAADKANGNYGKQAVDSVKLGANHTAVGEKDTEKSVDKSIKQNDQDNAQ